MLNTTRQLRIIQTLVLGLLIGTLVSLGCRYRDEKVCKMSTMASSYDDPENAVEVHDCDDEEDC